MPVSTVQQFGHEIALGLSENSTSWLFYNLGILYWRMKGDAPQAIECGRRAVYYAPRYTTVFHQKLVFSNPPIYFVDDFATFHFSI